MNAFAIFLLAVIIVVIILLSIQWPVLTGAPWWPTPSGKVRRMLEMAQVQPDEVVYDLGCGDGRVAIAAAKWFGARAVGIEIDPLRFLLAQSLVTILGLHKRITLHLGNFFSRDVSQADVIFTYLLQDTNERLFEKLRQELRPGTRVVSHSYTFPEWQLLEQDEAQHIYLYQV
jgi:cyclopropane fatty-acyl-phospholipid synthase-like methyltransferase